MKYLLFRENLKKGVKEKMAKNLRNIERFLQQKVAEKQDLIYGEIEMLVDSGYFDSIMWAYYEDITNVSTKEKIDFCKHNGIYTYTDLGLYRVAHQDEMVLDPNDRTHKTRL